MTEQTPADWFTPNPPSNPAPRRARPSLNGAAMIVAERLRQTSGEGWTPDHDDEHAGGELATAACCYALPPDMRRWKRVMSTGPGVGLADAVELYEHVPTLWPWKARWWKSSPDDRVRELVKAGALIAAEIDRIQRAEAGQ